MTEPVFTNVMQVAVVVRDLDRGVRTYADDYGIKPWLIYELNPDTVERMTRDGEPAAFAARIAVAKLGDVWLELIEPLDDASIYADFLRSHGEGLHHVGLAVPDYAGALALLERKGHRNVTSGVLNGVTFTYLSTEGDLGFLGEIFDWPPDVVPRPDAVYPPDAAIG
jgi:hypothetical protein